MTFVRKSSITDAIATNVYSSMGFRTGFRLPILASLRPYCIVLLFSSLLIFSSNGQPNDNNNQDDDNTDTQYSQYDNDVTTVPLDYLTSVAASTYERFNHVNSVGVLQDHTATTPATVLITARSLESSSQGPNNVSGISGNEILATTTNKWTTSNEDLDPCAPNPCTNDGVCTTDGVSFNCSCKKGWIGTTCSTADANRIACDKSTQPAVLGGATGTLGSLQQPYGYVKFSSCQWIIVAQPGEVVTLTLESFRTVSFYDTLEIFDGNSSRAPRIQLLSGYAYDLEHSGTFLSTGAMMFVNFTASNTVIDTATNESYGFQASYESEPLLQCNSSQCQNGGKCVAGRSVCQCLLGFTGEQCTNRLTSSFENCFADESENTTILDQRTIYVDKTMTYARCIQHCANLDYTYAGIKAGTICACGQVVLRNSSTDEADVVSCDNMCRGDQREKCGTLLNNYVIYIPGLADGGCSPTACPDQQVCIDVIVGDTFKCSGGQSCNDLPCLKPFSTCINTESTSYVCECPIGYTGDGCNIAEASQRCFNDDCCLGKRCLNGGTCYWLPTENTTACQCDTFFYGATCEFEQDSCLSKPCQNQGVCIKEPGSLDYSCNCTGDWRGKNCATNYDSLSGKIYPDSSPFQGGTLVTYYIEASAFSGMRVNAFGFGPIDKPEMPTRWVPVITSSSTIATARTPPMIDVRLQKNDTDSTGPDGVEKELVNVFVNFSNGITNTTYLITDFEFYYYELQVTGVDPDTFYIYTGGINLFISGQFPGFTNSSSITLVVRTTIKRRIGPDSQTEDYGTYLSTCDYLSGEDGDQDQIHCITPLVSVPSSIRENIESSTTDMDLSSSTKGYVEDDEGNSIEISFGILFNDNPSIYSVFQDISSLSTRFKMVLTAGPSVDLTDGVYVHQRGVDNWAPVWITKGDHGIGSRQDEDINDFTVYLEGKPGSFYFYMRYTDNDDPSYQENAYYLLWYVGPSTRVLNTSNAIPEIIDFDCDPGLLHLQLRIGYRVQRVSCVQELAPCNPSPCKNGATCRDFWDDYSCTCTQYFFDRNCSSPYPNITDISPSHGPIAGDTVVAITLRVPDYFNVDGLFIGSAKVQYQIETLHTEELDTFIFEGHDHNVTFNETITRFVLTQRISVTSPSVTRPSNVSVNIQFKWNETYMNVNATRTYPWQFSPFLLTTTADNPFEYRSNPTISKIYPLQQLYTGGTVLTVVGISMDSAVVPIATSWLTANWTYTQGFGAKTETAYFNASSNCTVQSSTQMLCPMPALRVTDSLLTKLNSKPYNASSTYGSVILAKTRGPNTYELWNTSSCRDIETKTMSTKSTSDKAVYATVNLNVKIKLKFDGYTDDSSAGNQQLDVYPPPYFCTDALLVYDGISELQIMGDHLLRAASVSDYRVQVEDVPFVVVGITNNYLSFSTPKAVTDLPIIDESPSSMCLEMHPYHYQIKVWVGSQENFAGCVAWNTSLDVDLCERVFCFNGGFCYINYATNNATCLCDDKHYGEFCQYGSPMLTGMTPVIGPRSGNTSVNIQGDWPSGIIPVAVLFNSTVITDIVVRNPGQITARSPSMMNVVVTDAGLSFVVSVRFNDSTIWNVTGSVFTYLPNPTFKSISPRDHITSGGTVVSIQGTNLNVTRTAIMTVVIVTQEQKRRDYDQMPPSLTIKSSTTNCSEHLGTYLVCRMPSIQAPDEFLQLLDKSTYNTEALLQRRKRQSSGGENGEHKNGNKSMTSYYRVKRDLTGLVDNTTGETMNVYVLLQMDGFSVNLSDVLPAANLLLHNPPKLFKPDDVIPFFVNRSQIVEFQGSGLTLGTLPSEDISVYVGGYLLPASDVTVFVNRTRIRPPDEITSNMTSLAAHSATTSICTTTGNADTSVNLTNTFIVEIHVGYAVYQAGCIEYLDDLPPFNYQRMLGIYIGVSIAGAFLIFVAIALITRQ